MYGHADLPGSVFVLGEQIGSTNCFMQISGTALRIRFDKLRELFRTLPSLNRRIVQHVQTDQLILSQLSACNRLHYGEERFARWLLMAADRLGSEELPLTQEFMGDMLGSPRSSVSVIAGKLQQRGLITYSRGTIRILDRKRLEQTSCECYFVVPALHSTMYADEQSS